MTSHVHMSIDRGVATLTLARPEARNALTDGMIEEASAALAAAGRDPNVRALLIAAEGEAFCAGTDVAWMELAARGRGSDDLYRLGSLLETLRTLPRPVVARVGGPAIGAGVAIIACADIAVCADDAFFQLPAVRLGSAPAVIGPYVIEGMGLRQARRYLLTGETFSADEAAAMGLVHDSCPKAELTARTDAVLDELSRGGPLAQRVSKTLLVARGHEAPSPSLLKEGAAKSTEVRRTPEGREGLAAFVEGRRPAWRR